MRFGLLIAVAVGVVVALDARRLGKQGVRVANIGPLVWGLLVALIAIIALPAYAICRWRATPHSA